MRFAKPLMLLAALMLTNSLVGCGEKPAAPATDEEKKELNKKMEDDMRKMQGLAPKKPGTKPKTTK